MINILYYSNTGGDLVKSLLDLHNTDCVTYENPTKSDWDSIDKKNSWIIYCDLETQSKIAYLKKDWFFKYFNQKTFTNHTFNKYTASFRNKNNNYIPTNIEDLFQSKMPQFIKKQIYQDSFYYVKEIAQDSWNVIFRRVLTQIAVEWNNKTIFIGYVSPINIDECKHFNLLDIIETKGKIITDCFDLEYDNKSVDVINNWIRKNKFDLLDITC